MTREAIVEKIAYTLANPVAAGLVRHAHEWLGAKVVVEELGCGVLRARRPAEYFDPTNAEWPETAALDLTLPPAINEGEAEGFRREVATALAREESKAHEKVERDGFLGAEQVANVSPYERAKSFEALGALNPTFASGQGKGDAWRRAAAAVRAFRSAYRAALKQWCAGMRDVLFPEGTWWMRVFHSVRVGGGALAGEDRDPAGAREELNMLGSGVA
jgi:hypothetical protein